MRQFDVAGNYYSETVRCDGNVLILKKGGGKSPYKQWQHMKRKCKTLPERAITIGEAFAVMLLESVKSHSECGAPIKDDLATLLWQCAS